VQEADRYYTAILKANPKHPDANHNMGVLAVGLGKVTEALPFFKIALEVNPKIDQYWLSYIDALIKLDRMADAKEVLDQAKNNDAKGDAFDQLEERLGSTPSKNSDTQEPPQEQLQSLINLYTQGQYQEALIQASHLLKQFPNSVNLYNIIGAANKGLGKIEEAIEAYQKAISLKPDFAEAYYNMGNAIKEQGKLDEAIEAYTKAISIKPDHAKGYNNMGIALENQGKLEEAIGAYAKTLSIKPDHAEAYYNMGNALKEQGKLDKAIEAYNKALKLKPDYAEAKTNLAILLFESRRFEEAEKFFSMNNSIKNQSYLLKCYYERDKKSKFYDQLDYLIKRGEINCVIGSYASRAAIRYGTKKYNPFCNDPLKYVLKTDLTKKCDFQEIFVENATNVLSNGEVNHKSQGHLKNGIQTSGNIFTQVGSVTNLWRDIIQSELKNYKDHFGDSEEGLIQNWPSDYSLFGWLVSMKNGGELSAHIHDSGWITGSIYINVPPKSKKDSGNLVVTTHDPKDGKGNTKDIKSIDIVTGSLCFFPSSLLHYTIPFESNEDRIVLAFDMIPN
jgi:tetratricopeptide (TPR) repeat protein